MKIKLLLVGKTDDQYLRTGISEYIRRVNFYIPFEIIEVSIPKNAGSLPVQQVKAKEAAALEKLIVPGDYLILLDEHGREMTSVEFAGYLNRHFTGSSKCLVFIVGGAFGFDQRIIDKAGFTLSLSRMTFSHQMVRLFFTEQLYRALTIIKGESYHHV
jgi:23S rRNA (pseudouridine1915-N3)-methyltransferase